MKRLLIFLSFMTSIFLHPCASKTYESKNIILVLKNVQFTVEIADTPQTIEQGLMYRHSLADNEGMLFLFKKLVKPSFWMKNTYLSLDLLFIDVEGKIQCIHQNAVPLSLTKLLCPLPVKAVLELSAGTVKKLNIQTGDCIHHDIFKRH